jgi:hypothetical protein
MCMGVFAMGAWVHHAGPGHGATHRSRLLRRLDAREQLARDVAKARGALGGGKPRGGYSTICTVLKILRSFVAVIERGQVVE